MDYRGWKGGSDNEGLLEVRDATSNMLWARVWPVRGIVPVVNGLGRELGGFPWASGDQLHGPRVVWH